MTEVKALIELLADGKFHSYEETERELKMSRTAIWQQLQNLQNYGLNFESLEDCGYYLSQPLSLLDRDEIIQFTDHSVMDYLSSMDIFFELDSTNAHAMRKLQSGEVSKGYVCLAEFQSRGRGRRGRQWLGPLGSSITFSLVWEFDNANIAIEGLSLVIGIAVARTLVSQGLPHVQLKWPNDILLGGAKLGGILLEVSANPTGPRQVVIGVGLNVSTQADALNIDQPWTALEEHLSGVSRSKLFSALLSELLLLLSDYCRQGFSAFVEEWKRYDAYQGKMVEVISGNHRSRGKVLGIACSGALILEVKGQRQLFYGGEISVRLPR
ncbi:MAG: BirA family biotin operon repressor/biotin-[acetyl-CoA-carboxylase] ligase [Cellvibrionaceae bacterium]|jgi:BirA family biotin operon repressor/biotin-[acetyl-CoA-carboxylase] ligase